MAEKEWAMGLIRAGDVAPAVGQEVIRCVFRDELDSNNKRMGAEVMN